MTWQDLATFQLRSTWQYTPLTEGGYFRIYFASYTPGTAILLAQAQLLYGPEHFSPLRISCKPQREIIELISPPFFEARRLGVCGVGVRPDFNPIQLSIEVSSMPVYNPSNVTVNQPVATSATSATIASSTTSVTLIAANANRRGLTIYNNSTSRLYVDHDASVSLTDFAVLLEAGGFYEVPAAYVPLQMTGIWSSVNGNALVREFA